MRFRIVSVWINLMDMRAALNGECGIGIDGPVAIYYELSNDFAGKLGKTTFVHVPRNPHF
jgi:hypothetical protein